VPCGPPPVSSLPPVLTGWKVLKDSSPAGIWRSLRAADVGISRLRGLRLEVDKKGWKMDVATRRSVQMPGFVVDPVPLPQLVRHAYEFAESDR
jgi:hypothetical protein